MTTTAEVYSTSVQPDGRQYVVFEFTHVESGSQWLSGTHRLASGVVPAVVGAGLTADAEAQQTQAELNRWAFLFLAGVDLDTLATPSFSTLNQCRRYALRQLFNLMRSGVPDDGKGRVATNVLPYLGKYSNGQIASILGGWSAAQVGVARGKLQAMADALTALDHGQGEV